MSYLIASYPRSGNHLVRGLLEWAFRRPTLGCPGARHDPPLGEEPANLARGLIGFESPEPIGFKAHHLHQANLIRRQVVRVGRLVLITRNPADAIASQLLRRFPWYSWLGSRRLRVSVEREVSDYLAVVWLYRGWPADRREHLEFARLIDPEGSLEYVNAFLGRQGSPRHLDAATWAELRRMTWESQRSLGHRSLRRRSRIKRAVESLVTAGDVEILVRE